VSTVEQELREPAVRRKLRESEKALQESEKRYRQVVENATDIIYTVDEKGNFTYANPAGLKVTGYSLGELQKLNYTDLVLPEHRERVLQTYINQFRERLATTYVEFPFICKAGEIIWFGQNATLVMETEKIVGFHVIARDITERKRAEEKLRKASLYARSLIEASLDPLVTISSDGKITDVNQATEQVTGITRNRLIGSDFSDYFTEPVKARKGYQRVLTEGLVRDYPLSIRHISGRTTDVLYNATIYRNEAGEVQGVFAAARDITERKKAEQALRLASAYNRSLIEASLDPLVTIGSDGRITDVNVATEKVTGHSREKLIGTDFMDYFSEPDKAKAGYQQVFQDGFVQDYALEIRHKDGHLTPVLYNASVYRDEAGQAMGVFAVARDITEQKRAEEALQKSLTLYRGLIETTDTGFVILDQEGKVLDANQEYVHLSGREDLSQIRGRNVVEWTADYEKERNAEAVAKCFREGRVRDLEIDYVNAQGKITPIEINATAVKVDGAPQILTLCRDITERKKVEEALRSGEEKYRTILENIEDGYFEVDIAGNLTFFNDSFSRIYGYPREELMGMNDRQYTDQENAKRLFQAFNRVYKTGDSTKESDWEIIRKDGAKRSIEASVSLIKDSSGNRIGFRGLIRDVTERKRAEEEKATLQEQLRQSQKMEAIGRLAGGVAHDFNNLLTVIKGYCQLSLVEMKESTPLKDTLEVINKAAEKAAGLTRQLLAFGRRQIMEVRVLDLNDLLQNFDKMLRRIISEDIELVMLLGESLGKVKADPGQIEQVVMNLAVNAKDAMSKGGKLIIETANVELDKAYAQAHVAVTPGSYVMVAVNDTGTGMTPEVRDRVFEPFFTTKGKGKGTGLGLSTVYGIVKQSGGNIWVYSEPGQGTTLKIYLPRVDEPAEELKAQEAGEEFPRGSETILIVEDDKEVRSLAVRILKRQGYTVLDGSYGDQAFNVCRQHRGPIHLLLTDVVMPGMDGRALSESLSQLHPEMKVLYMSGYTDDAIIHHGVMDKGMNFIQKPFTIDKLIRKVREILDKDLKHVV